MARSFFWRPLRFELSLKGADLLVSFSKMAHRRLRGFSRALAELFDSVLLLRRHPLPSFFQLALTRSLRGFATLSAFAPHAPPGISCLHIRGVAAIRRAFKFEVSWAIGTPPQRRDSLLTASQVFLTRFSIFGDVFQEDVRARPPHTHH